MIFLDLKTPVDAAPIAIIPMESESGNGTDGPGNILGSQIYNAFSDLLLSLHEDEKGFSKTNGPYWFGFGTGMSCGARRSPV